MAVNVLSAVEEGYTVSVPSLIKTPLIKQDMFRNKRR